MDIEGEEAYMGQTTSDERMLAAAIYIVSFFFPLMGPLIIWLIKRNESDFIDYHGREYLNFFISYIIYGFIGTILIVVLIGFLILPVVGFFAVVFTIIGAIKAFDGVKYRIPFVLRIL